MKKTFFLLFNLIIITSCQKESSKPAIVNPPLKVKKEAPEKTAFEYGAVSYTHLTLPTTPYV